MDERVGWQLASKSRFAHDAPQTTNGLENCPDWCNLRRQGCPHVRNYEYNKKCNPLLEGFGASSTSSPFPVAKTGCHGCLRILQRHYRTGRDFHSGSLVTKMPPLGQDQSVSLSHHAKRGSWTLDGPPTEAISVMPRALYDSMAPSSPTLPGVPQAGLPPTSGTPYHARLSASHLFRPWLSPLRSSRILSGRGWKCIGTTTIRTRTRTPAEFRFGRLDDYG